MLLTNAGEFIAQNEPNGRSTGYRSDNEVWKKLCDNGLPGDIHCSYPADEVRLDGHNIIYSLRVWSIYGQDYLGPDECQRVSEIMGLKMTVTVEAHDIIVELGSAGFDEDTWGMRTLRVFYYASELRDALRALRKK